MVIRIFVKIIETYVTDLVLTEVYVQNFSSKWITFYFCFFPRQYDRHNDEVYIKKIIKTFTSMSHVNRSFEWGRTLGKIVNGEKSGFKQKSTYLITSSYRDRLCCFVYLVLHIGRRLSSHLCGVSIRFFAPDRFHKKVA